MVVIVLDAFNLALTPTAAFVATSPVDAVAEYEVSLAAFIAMFKIYASDSISDTSNTNTYIKYYVDGAGASPLAGFNPVFSRVTMNAATFTDINGTTLAPNKMGVVNDYMRKLSLDMLGSPHLSYLFTNDYAVQSDIVSQVKTKMTALRAKLDSLKMTDTTHKLTLDDGETQIDLLGTTGDYHTDNTMTSKSNICRELFLALLKQAPERFADIVYDGKQSLPFVTGDRISFKTILKNTNQTGTAAGTGAVGWAASGQIPDRVYTIILILKSDLEGDEITNTCSEFLKTQFVGLF